MKKIAFFYVFCATVIVFAACKKNSTPHVPVDYSLTIQPGLVDGQDCYVSHLDNHPEDTATNINDAHELVAARWAFSQFNNDSATQRTYIRFDSLSKVPVGATVTEADLYLYGETSSVSYPYGNSYYSGSSNPENSCLVQRVTGGTWDQTTIAWYNAPATTTVGQDTIPPSTSAFGYDAVVNVTGLVKDMVANPKTNYGFCIRLVNEKIYRAIEFASSESSDPTKRPMLVVQYKY